MAQMFRPAPTPNDTLISVVVDADGRVTFSIYAPGYSEKPGGHSRYTRRDNLFDFARMIFR